MRKDLTYAKDVEKKTEVKVKMRQRKTMREELQRGKKT